MRIAVVVPAYNEAGNIGPLIEETIAAPAMITLRGASPRATVEARAAWCPRARRPSRCRWHELL